MQQMHLMLSSLHQAALLQCLSGDNCVRDQPQMTHPGLARMRVLRSPRGWNSRTALWMRYPRLTGLLLSSHQSMLNPRLDVSCVQFSVPCQRAYLLATICLRCIRCTQQSRSEYQIMWRQLERVAVTNPAQDLVSRLPLQSRPLHMRYSERSL